MSPTHRLLQDLVRLPSVNPMGRTVTGEQFYEHRVTAYLEGFFIDLGRILSGELSGDLHDKLDADIAEICIANPGISTRDALVELKKRAHESLEEHTIRTRKKRLGLTRQQNRKL